MAMARSRAGAHPKQGWRPQYALACADQWHIGWEKQELLVENGQDHEQDDKIPRSRRVEDLGSGAYDYKEMRPTSKAPWRTSSSAGRCCSSSFGRRPRLVHRGIEGPGGGVPRSQIVQEAARQNEGAHLQPLRTARASTGRRSSTPAPRSWRRCRESVGGGEWVAGVELGGGVGVEHGVAAVGRAEWGTRERDRLT
jgi:hypothetical protein